MIHITVQSRLIEANNFYSAGTMQVFFLLLVFYHVGKNGNYKKLRIFFWNKN